MLTVNDDGVSIRLNGSAADPLFWWSAGLLVLGIIVAAVCVTMPVEYAIGSLFVFAVAMFGFNIKRHQAKKRHLFAQGILKLSPKRFEIDQKALTLSDTAIITEQAGVLMVTDRGIEYHFTGFETEQEMSIAKAVLSGQSVAKNHVAVRMVGSEN